MVEVFRTTVDHHAAAFRLTEAIHRLHPHWRANFDLTDCDRILRVETRDEAVDPCKVISLLISHGYFGEALDDTVAPLAQSAGAAQGASFFTQPTTK